MKYIRTKQYGICKVTNEDMHTLSYKNSYICGCLWKDDYKDEIQYADTIEELCDEYVVNCSKDYEYPEYYPKVCEYWLLDDYSKADGFTIYGAIWTDKGLIYVAKMNDEGELELL